jgi:hypothetical protein
MPQLLLRNVTRLREPLKTNGSEFLGSPTLLKVTIGIGERVDSEAKIDGAISNVGRMNQLVTKSHLPWLIYGSNRAVARSCSSLICASRWIVSYEDIPSVPFRASVSASRIGRNVNYRRSIHDGRD